MQDIDDVAIVPVQDLTGNMNTLTVSSENLRDEVMGVPWELIVIMREGTTYPTDCCIATCVR